MASFNYNLQQPYRKDKDGKTLKKKGKPVKGTKETRFYPVKGIKATRLYLFVIHDQKHVIKLKTEHLIIPEQWDFKKHCVIPQVTASVILNKKLNDLIEITRNEYDKLRSDYPDMKWNELKENLKGFIKNKTSPIYSNKNKPFFTIFDEFTETKSNQVSHLTVKKYLTLKASLIKFKPDLCFNDINQKFYSDYIQYLRNKEPIGRQKTREPDFQNGLLNDSVGKYIEGLKLFLKWSYENDNHSNLSHTKTWFRINQKSKKQKEQGKNDIVTLRINEIFHLYNFDINNNPRLERVKDLFCFMAFTLQRWSDAIRFDKKNVIKTQFEGEIVDAWRFKSYKTGKTIEVPFVGNYLGMAIKIAKKYNFSLPIISEQKFNDYIKEVCKLAGLDREKEIKRYIGPKEIISNKPLYEYISSHTGRRTGISILLNVYQMPIHFVRDISGHSDLKTLDRYLERDSQALIGSLIKNTNGVVISPLRIAK